LTIATSGVACGKADGEEWSLLLCAVM